MKILDEIRKEIARLEKRLLELRGDFDIADANDVHSQGVIAQEISKTVIELETMESFLSALLEQGIE
jgi:hypothetical protein